MTTAPDDSNIIEGEFVSKAVAVRDDYNLTPPLSVAQWGERLVTPPHLPIPIPSYLGPDWTPNWAAIPSRTPKDEIREAINEKTGAVMYKFVTTGYVVRTLDKLARGHNWGTEIFEEGKQDERPNGDYEYVVALQYVMPGLFRPIMGIGSSTYHKSNPQDTMAKTRAGAYTAALKSAAKQLGIGRDLDEDDPAFNQLVDGRVRTISMMYDRLVERGSEADAKEIIRRHAPTALLDSGKLLATQIDFEKLEPVQKDLSNLALKLGAKAAEAVTVATEATSS